MPQISDEKYEDVLYAARFMKSEFQQWKKDSDRNFQKQETRMWATVVIAPLLGAAAAMLTSSVDDEIGAPAPAYQNPCQEVEFITEDFNTIQGYMCLNPENELVFCRGRDSGISCSRAREFGGTNDANI